MGVVEPTLCSKITPWPFYRYGIFTVQLHLFFCNLLISRKPIHGIDWPARSPYLNHWNTFLWGYLESKVYCPKPRTLDDLENNIGLPTAKHDPPIHDIKYRAMKCLQASSGGNFQKLKIVFLYDRALYTPVFNSFYIKLSSMLNY